LHHEEFTQPRLLPRALTRSYRVVSPITLAGWFAFCCTCRRLKFQTPGRYPARRPAVFGLSSLEIIQQRLPDLTFLQGSVSLTKSVEQIQYGFKVLACLEFNEFSELTEFGKLLCFFM
jgi:hypothetical protein